MVTDRVTFFLEHYVETLWKAGCGKVSCNYGEMGSLCSSFASTSLSRSMFCNVETHERQQNRSSVDIIRYGSYSWDLLGKCGFYRVWPILRIWVIFFLIFHQPGFALDSPETSLTEFLGFLFRPHVALSMYGSWTFEHTAPAQQQKLPPNQQSVLHALFPH